jgi:putative nucleotidyltransferase with HDIG domain
MEKSATHICQVLQDNGFQALLAGGCVRDGFFVGNEVHDIDIATNATPDQVEALFPKTIPVGKAFGVIIVVHDEEQFEVATFRTDHGTDGRRPQSVEFSSAEEDAKRRDLTINGIFEDPVSRKILDFVGGVNDIRHKVIRFIGDPKERIEEDLLRMLRVARFAAKFHTFVIARDTKEAVQENAHRLADGAVSGERIKAELDKMLSLDKPSRAINILHDLNLLEVVLPEIAAMIGVEHSRKWHQEGNVFEHSMMVLDETANCTDDVACRWAALFHDAGKPKTAAINKRGDISNNGHEFVSAKMVEEVFKDRFKASNKEIEKVSFIAREHMKVKQVRKMRKHKVWDLVDNEFIDDLILVSAADSSISVADDPLAEPDKLGWVTFLSQWERERGFKKPQALITGADLIEKGLKPGPRFKEILGRVAKDQLDGKLSNREEALEFLRKTFKI